MAVEAPLDLPAYRAALDYARRGWFVAPLHSVRPTADDGRKCTCSAGAACASPGKHPRLPRGYQPSRDPAQISAWWREYPDSNVALFPGPSGFLVIDIDPRNGGDDAFADLEKRYGELPEGPTAHTGGGGLHYYLWRPAHVDEIRSCVLAPGVELKGRTGYVVAPPGHHYSGREYAWDAGRGLELALPDAPQWLIRLSRSSRTAQSDQKHPDGPLAGLMGQVFAASGSIGPMLGPDKVAVICPWENEHSTGRRFDSSTVVFAPTVGKRFGWFHCSHSHCAGRSLDDVIAAMPPAAVRAAQSSLGITDLGAGWYVAPPWPEDEDIEGAPVAPVPDEGDADWRTGLRVNSDGQLTRDPGNAVLLLVNDEAWAGTLAWDGFRDRYVWASDAPIGLTGMPRPRKGEQLADHHSIYVQQWLAKFKGCPTGVDAVRSALAAACHANETHPVREYLKRLEWDGTPRLDDGAMTYLGAHAHFAGRMFRWWFISAVARILDPGCQADHMLILEGPQGARKSTALKIIGDPWVLESLPNLRDGVRASEAIQGKWIIVVNELDAMRGVDATRVKDFLTIREDSYRGAYKAFVSDRPRQCVFAGTTNEKYYLGDSTGGRRFWPIATSNIDCDALRRDRDQLWAEAYAGYRKGERWWPAEHDEELEIRTEQDARHDDDEWESAILRWVSGREGFTIAEVLVGALDIVNPEKWDRKAQARVGHVLGRHKYDPVRTRQVLADGTVVRVRRYYRRPVIE